MHVDIIKDKEISWCLEAANKKAFAGVHESSVFNDETPEKGFVYLMNLPFIIGEFYASE